jgi:hypothetical protein
MVMPWIGEIIKPSGPRASPFDPIKLERMDRVPAIFALVCLSVGAIRRLVVRFNLDLLAALPYTRYADEKRLGIAIVLELALKFGESLARDDHHFAWILELLALVGVIVLAALGILYFLGRFKLHIIRRNFLDLLSVVCKDCKIRSLVISTDSNLLSDWLRQHYPAYDVPSLVEFINHEYKCVPANT